MGWGNVMVRVRVRMSFEDRGMILGRFRVRVRLW